MVFYRPKHDRTGEMWDTWLYWRDGLHHLYYLAKAGDQWDNISMATSPDGLRWTEVGPILQKSEGVTWMTPARLDVSRGLFLECRLLLPPTPFEPRRGLYLESMDGCGTGVLFDAQGRAEFCTTNSAGTICKVVKRVDREAIFSKPAVLRLVMKHSLMEVYLDDILIDVFSPPAPFSGRIGLIRGGDRLAISKLVVASCTGDARP